MKLLVIDSGTTTSRVRLVDGQHVLASVSRLVGAKDVAITGNNVSLMQAIKECIEQILAENGVCLCNIDAIIASGMISSNMGLVEIPHLVGPVGIRELADNIVQKTFPEITTKPFNFIPGIKTGFEQDNCLNNMDIMRGEETEIFGCVGEDQDCMFMHYGSHHKCILVSDGKISQSRTSLTGELMMSVAQSTILKSSLVPLEELAVDLDWVHRGLEAAESSGFGRALFSGRILDVVVNRSKMDVTNFYLGILLSLDIDILQPLITESVKRFVLYGKKLFPTIFAPIVTERFPQLQVSSVSEELSDTLSVQGAIKIYSASIS